MSQLPLPKISTKLLDEHIGYQNNPIRLHEHHAFKIKCKMCDQQWKDHVLKNKFWAQNTIDSFNEMNPGVDLLSNKKLFAFKEALLKHGGEAVVLPVIKEDLTKIMERGQFWEGDHSKIVKGRPSQCHQNSTEFWNKKQENLFLVTGYALSDDGIWRQHSWCVNPTSGKTLDTIQIIETTLPRELYFGFALTLKEINYFAYENNVHIHIKDETIVDWKSKFSPPEAKLVVKMMP